MSTSTIIHPHMFADIELIFRDKHNSKDSILEEKEFKFLLATAVQTIHGDITNQIDLIKFNFVSELSKYQPTYKALIKFKTVHFTRIITSLILFGDWKGQDCRFSVNKVAQNPILLLS